MQAVAYEIDRKMGVSYSLEIFKKMRKRGVKNEIQEINACLNPVIAPFATKMLTNNCPPYILVYEVNTIYCERLQAVQLLRLSQDTSSSNMIEVTLPLTILIP